MEFNHLSFYVDAVAPWLDWFVNAWGGSCVQARQQPGEADRALVHLGQVPLLLEATPAATQAYRHQHPPGIGDLAFRVVDLDIIFDRVLATGGTVAQPIQTDPWGRGRWGQIQGWGSLRHTLVESRQPERWVPEIAPSRLSPDSQPSSAISAIDHAVINVPTGKLAEAVAWYTSQLGFCPQQQFTIDTPRSGLQSQVLAHPQGSAQLPINEPATTNSQVQEFLDYNRGSGIQHVALHTRDIVRTVGQLRTGGVKFLAVPQSYYEALEQRPGYTTEGNLTTEGWHHQAATLARLQILVDWEPHMPQARLLQTFTQPFLTVPTVFFELIQRQSIWANGSLSRAQGFGERNFQALFEAIEREQIKRGTLA